MLGAPIIPRKALYGFLNRLKNWNPCAHTAGAEPPKVRE
jgi:hypothetical protein